MIINNSINLGATNNADGFDITGGQTNRRKIALSGGDISLVGSGSATISYPTANTTLVGTDTTDNLTNKTLTSPTLVTPALGTPASGVLTNCTGTASGLTSGNVVVANEAADTTCFPVFVTAATGNLPAKSNTGLTYNASTNALGATTFSGALSGNASTVTGGTYIKSSNDLTAQTAAVTSITTVTVVNDSAYHTFSVGGYLTVTAISVNTITLQVTYTDETNTSTTQSFFGQGLSTAAIGTTGAVSFPPMTIRAKFNTAITLKTIVTGAGSETYDVGGYIQSIN